MRVTSKWQVTIPQGIRERSGITSGTEIDFTVRGGEVVITKGKERGDQLEAWLRVPCSPVRRTGRLRLPSFGTIGQDRPSDCVGPLAKCHGRAIVLCPLPLALCHE